MHNLKNQSKEAMPQRVIEGHASMRQVRRPCNAFFFFCSRHRDLVQSENPELENRVVTSILAAWWHSLRKEVKDQYRVVAASHRREHKLAHPDFKWYKAKVASGPSPVTRSKRLVKTDTGHGIGNAIIPGKLADLTQMGNLSSLIHPSVEPTNKRNEAQHELSVEIDFFDKTCNNNNNLCDDDHKSRKCEQVYCSQNTGEGRKRPKPNMLEYVMKCPLLSYADYLKKKKNGLLKKSQIDLTGDGRRKKRRNGGYRSSKKARKSGSLKSNINDTAVNSTLTSSTPNGNTSNMGLHLLVKAVDVLENGLNVSLPSD